MPNSVHELRGPVTALRRGRKVWRLLTVVIFFFVASISPFCLSAAEGTAPEVCAIRNAKIVTGGGQTYEKGTVVFRKGLITDVGDSVKIPTDAWVVDGTGLIVYPGLIDSFTNLGLPAPAAASMPGGSGRSPAGSSGPDATVGDPSVIVANQLSLNNEILADSTAMGITAAFSAPRQGIFAGQGAVINLSGMSPAKAVVRSPVALVVQFVSSGGGLTGSYPQSLMGTVAYIRQTFYDAIHYRDEIKRFELGRRGVIRPAYDKKLAALQPFLRGEVPVLFVANSEGDIRRSLMITDEFKLKPIIAGALYGYRMVDVLKSRNVPVLLFLNFPKRAADFPEDEDETLRVLQDRAEIPKGATSLAKAGIKFALASGPLRPSEFNTNLQKAIEQGLSREDALRALTRNAAEILDVGDQLGTIEVGKIANLVVVKGELFSKDGKIDRVFVDGIEIELKKPEAAAPKPGGTGAPPQSDR
jgi:imidazolonepropionase-like amidohydrolase